MSRLFDIPAMPSGHQIGEVILFQPNVLKIDFRTNQSTDGVRAEIVGVNFKPGKITYDLAVANPDGGFYNDAPIRNVDSVMICAITKLRVVP